MQHEFTIIRKDKKGKPIRDDDDQLIYDEYVYNYELMTIDRMLSAKKLFILSQKEYELLPKDADELTTLITREAERQAFAAILMKRNDDGTFERYDPYNLMSFNALSEIQGGDNYNKLIQCQENFFLKVQIQSPELVQKSLNIMRQSTDILNNYHELAKNTGLEIKDLIKIVIEGTKLSKEKTKENSTTEQTYSKKASEKR